MNRREFLKKSVKTVAVVAAVPLIGWPDNPEPEEEDLGGLLVPEGIRETLLQAFHNQSVIGVGPARKGSGRTVVDWQMGGAVDFDAKLRYEEI